MPMKVDTAALLQAADAFEQLHARAEKAIEAMNAQWKREIRLRSGWDGPAGEQAQEAFAAFREKYCERYLQMLRNYQHFLRETAAGGYAKAEQQNTALSELVAEGVGMCPETEPSGFTDSVQQTVSEWILKLR